MTAPTSSPPPPVAPGTTVDSVAEAVGVLGGSALRAVVPSGTPGRMRLAQLGLSLLLVITAVVLNRGVAARADAIATAGDEAAPVLLAAQEMKSALADANAAAANNFLAGGIEQIDQRERYEAGIAAASTQLNVAAGQATASAGPALQTVATGLPRYTGLVESARANNRQLAPVGAAYLRQANALLQGELVPAIEALRDEGDSRLRAAGGDASGGVSWGVVALLVVSGLALLWVLRFLRLATRRVVNVGVAVALALVGVTLLWTLFAVGRSAADMADARTDGYEPLGTLSEVRALAFTAKGDEARALINRGSGAADYQRVELAALTVEELLNRLEGISASTAGSIRPAWNDWIAVHREIASNDAQGLYDDAVALATAPLDERGTNSIFLTLDQRLGEAITSARGRFEASTEGADDALGALGVVGPILLLLAAAAVVWGIQQRVREYL